MFSKDLDNLMLKQLRVIQKRNEPVKTSFLTLVRLMLIKMKRLINPYIFEIINQNKFCFPFHQDWCGIIHLVCTQMFRKTNSSYPVIRTYAWAYQGVTNVSFSEHFPYVLNGKILKSDQERKIPTALLGNIYTGIKFKCKDLLLSSYFLVDNCW